MIMKKVYLIEGEKGSGKSEWIHNKNKQLIESGWEPVKSENATVRDIAIFVLKRESQIVVLNSGSDTKEIIKNFSRFLLDCEDVSEVYTAIRPQEKNPRLHKWMKDALKVLGSTKEIICHP
jgi:hypothetical protein